MSISQLNEWEEKQILEIGCNFYNCYKESPNDEFPLISKIRPIIGICNISHRGSFCMGKEYCPYWKK